MRIHQTLVVLATLCAQSAWADYYYVRPYSTTVVYGLSNGTAYQHAWNGLGRVQWKNASSSSGVGPGDTLYICGIHPNPFDSPSEGNLVVWPGNDHTQLKVLGSGEAGRPITISFECKDGEQADSGTILRVAAQYLFERGTDEGGLNEDEGWTKLEGFDDVYQAVRESGNLVTPLEMEYSGTASSITPTYRRLNKATASPTENPDLWRAEQNVGMAYFDAGAERLYYRPTPGVDRAAFYMDGVRSAIQITGQQHIRIVGREGYDPLHKLGKEDFAPPADRDLNILASDIRTRGAHHIKIEGLNIKFSKDGGITPNDNVVNAGMPREELLGCSDIEIHHNRIEWSRVGIYNSVQTVTIEGEEVPTSCDRLWIHHNHVFHTDVENFYSSYSFDKHGIQIEGGDGHVVEHNVIEEVGTHAIGFDGTGSPHYGSVYAPSRNMHMNGNVVRYNFIRDVDSHNVVNSSETGFHVNGNNQYYDPEKQKHNRVHNNIIVGAADAGVAITVTGKPQTGGYSWAYYNNVVHGSTVGYRFSDSYPSDAHPWDVGFVFKNNLIVDSAVLHASMTGPWYNHERTDRSGIRINNNGYSGPGTAMFGWLDSGVDSALDFSDWKQIVSDAPCFDDEETADIYFDCPEEMDGAAILLDPQFTNPSGTFSYASDFVLPAFSSAIDAGTFDIARDANNNPIEMKTDILDGNIYGLPDLGAVEYQPPYQAGVDGVTEHVRFYGDGRFRERLPASSPVSAGLIVRPLSGYQETNVYRRMYWDVSVHNWDASEKSWTVKDRKTAGDSDSLYYVVDDLVTGQPYDVFVNGTYWITRNAFAPGRIEFARGGPSAGYEWRFSVRPTP